MQEIICHNEEETKVFASNLASILSTGDIIILKGELGSGKTKFVEGILRHFGMEDEISSPTFTIVNEYHNDKADIMHFDLYRLSDVAEFDMIGGEEYFERGICLFEWGELIEDTLYGDYIIINIEKSDFDENVRIFKIETVGEKFQNVNFNNFFKTIN